MKHARQNDGDYDDGRNPEQEDSSDRQNPWPNSSLW